MELSPASDIYALGATMYKLLTGLNPLPSADILNEGFTKMEVELRKNNVSTALIKIIEKAMSVGRKYRYQTIESFSHAIRKVCAWP